MQRFSLGEKNSLLTLSTLYDGLRVLDRHTRADLNGEQFATRSDIERSQPWAVPMAAGHGGCNRLYRRLIISPISGRSSSSRRRISEGEEGGGSSSSSSSSSSRRRRKDRGGLVDLRSRFCATAAGYNCHNIVTHVHTHARAHTRVLSY